MDRAEYKRKWDAEHIDTRREQWKKGSKKYRDDWKASDPEGYKEYTKQANQKSYKKNHVPHSEMSEEALAKRRKQLLEAQNRYRAKKKAEKAQQEKENGNG